MTFSRRKFLTLGLTAIATVPLLSQPAWALVSPPEKTLKFVHLHTGETLKTTFWEKGRYIPEALSEINTLLRDFRTGELMPIDPKLMDVLHNIQSRTETSKPFHIISAYRSPKTNEGLRGKSHGVAKGSLHVHGKAIDVRLPGVDCKHIYQAALTLKSGGTGYYPESDFVHLDTGRVRHWS